MSQIWMYTGPTIENIDWPPILENMEPKQRKVTKRELRIMLEKNDCHKWQLGFEEGTDGYRHYQGRCIASSDNYFEWCKAHIPTLHLEKAERWSDYERKEGYYIANDDTPEIRSTRFGTLTDLQRQALNWLKQQSVREIDFWYDPRGYNGKSFLVNHLWETRQGHYIRPMASTDRIIADVCSKMEKERRPYLLIDVPRVEDVKGDLLGALEVIKDGLVDDPRYQGTTINIRGVKVLVMTNNKVKNLSKLSEDRVFVNGKKYGGGIINGQGKTRKEIRKMHSSKHSP